MTIKRQLSGLITAAMAMALGTTSINSINTLVNIKELKAPRKPKIPKTPADYEAIHAAEMKRRRKAALRAQQHTSAA